MPPTAWSSRYCVRAEDGSPKRSESSTAIGRAPIAKMSRRIPPTPVAAPWNGSTALGWLCDSTLNATARPSPTSTASSTVGSAAAPLGGDALTDRALEQLEPVGRPGQRVDRVLGVRHQADD